MLTRVSEQRSLSPTVALLQEYDEDELMGASVAQRGSPTEAMLAMFGEEPEPEDAPASPTLGMLEGASVAQGGLYAIGGSSETLQQRAHDDVQQASSAGGKGGSSKFYQSKVQRASRTARPCTTSSPVQDRCKRRIREAKAEAEMRGKKQRKNVAERGSRGGASCKGPGVRISEEEQLKMNHVLALKSKDLGAHNAEPVSLLGGATAPMMYDRLTQNAQKSNAVQAAVTDKKKTEASSPQTSRNYAAIGQAAAAQMVSCELTMALLKRFVRRNGCRHDSYPNAGWKVVDPMATNAVVPAGLVLLSDCDWRELGSCESFVCTTSSLLLYNSMPTKLSMGSIVAEAKRLARSELDDQRISSVMGYSNAQLKGLCRAIVHPGEYDDDPVWASMFLIVYIMSDARGRRVLLQPTTHEPLTDVDFHVAVVLEAYARQELTRRARLRRKNQLQAEQRKWEDEVKKAKEALELGEQQLEMVRQEYVKTFPMTTAMKTEFRKMQSHVEELQANCAAAEAGAKKQEQTAVEEAVANSEKADDDVIATKRRRSGKGQASAASSDPAQLLDWWSRALKKDDASVLKMLVARSQADARKAAEDTLERQAAGYSSVAQNEVIRHIAGKAAVSSAQALVPLVGRTPADTPELLALHLQRAFATKNAECEIVQHTACGIKRTRGQERNTLLLACSVGRPTRLKRRRDLVIAWSSASCKLKPDVREGLAKSPNIAERMSWMHCLQQKCTGMSDAKMSQQFMRYSNVIEQHSGRAMLPHVSGITRSLLSMRMIMPVAHHHVNAMGGMEYEWCTFVADELKEKGLLATPSVGPIPVSEVCGSSQQPKLRGEPKCSDNSALAVGLAMNEAIRVWPIGKTRRGDEAKHIALPEESPNPLRDAPGIMDSEPLPLMTITDVGIEVLEGWDHDGFDAFNSTGETKCAVALHTCADGAIRLPEVLNLNLTVLEKRALLWAGMSQASYIDDVGSSITAGIVNSNIASSKRLSLADNTTAGNFTVYEVYYGGLCNIHPDFVGTAWAGQYGSRIDHGISPPGLLAHNYRSDKRHHGSMMLRQGAADELAEAVAEKWVFEFADGKTFDVIPRQTAGVPHNLTPGLHAGLEDYTSALETVREKLGRQEEDTVDQLMVLPVSAWTQQLPPDIEATADPSHRLCVRHPEKLSTVSGRAYLPCASEENMALMKEPLWRRSCVASVVCNPFATALENGKTFWGLANGLALLCEQLKKTDCGEPPTKRFFDVLELYGATSQADLQPCVTADELLLTSDACVMLNLMYVSSWGINEEMLEPVFAKRLPRAVRRYKEGERNAVNFRLKALALMGEEEETATGEKFVRGILRMRPQLACLLEAILEAHGSHNLNWKERYRTRDAFDNAVKASYEHHCEMNDGLKPAAKCPASEVDSWKNVGRPQLDPWMVGNLETGLKARGALVGVKPHQMRQVAALCMGAHVEGVEVQAVRNEGPLSLRISSAADVTQKDGVERTLKAIHPLQTEAENDGMGARSDKIVSAALQRSAWDANTRLLTPIFLALSEPLPLRQRQRGELGRSQMAQAKATEARCKHMYENQDEKDAFGELIAASGSRRCEQVERVLAA
tara:strand:+ start:5947 stop:10713 length:4767 start_codon:yes stop_codon:yes gene_type:complete